MLCFSVQTTFWKWLNWNVINLGFLGVILNGIFQVEFLFLLYKFSANYKWIYHRDISTCLSMHKFTSLRSFYISATFYILCLFYCLVSVNLVKVADQNFYYKTRINIRAIQIIFITISMKTIPLMLGSICTCLRELYLMLFNAY